MPTPLRTPQTSGHSSSYISNIPLWSLKSPPSHGSKIIIFHLSQNKCTVSALFLHTGGKAVFFLALSAFDNSYSVSMSMEISPRSYLDNVARLLWIAGASSSNVIFRLCRNLFPISILILDIAALRNHRFLCTENRITLLIEILLDLKPNVNFCEKMSRVFQTKTAYITNDAGGFLGGVKRKSKSVSDNFRYNHPCPRDRSVSRSYDHLHGHDGRSGHLDQK